jgi:hypothetical protein
MSSSSMTRSEKADRPWLPKDDIQLAAYVSQVGLKGISAREPDL